MVRDTRGARRPVSSPPLLTGQVPWVAGGISTGGGQTGGGLYPLTKGVKQPRHCAAEGPAHQLDHINTLHQRRGRALCVLDAV